MKPIASMNVIPFIDVMLVLLAIVLTTATFVAQGRIPVELPQAAQTTPLPSGETIDLTVDADGVAYLDELPLDAVQLAAALSGRDPRTPVLLRVDAAASFRDFVVVIDALRAAQLDRLSIVTRQDDG